MNHLPPLAKAFFEAYLERIGIKATPDLRVSAAVPGDKQIADELVALYLNGKKFAGSGLVADYEQAHDPLPQVGDYWIVLDGDDRPRCITKTVRVEIQPFAEVTSEIARAEGEGDLSLEYWRDAHRRFFTPLLPKLGITDLDKALVISEFFEVVDRSLYHGSCACRTVTFAVNGELPGPDACHCATCRKISGHYFVSTDVPRKNVAIHGAEKITWYQSSEKARRGFCSVCGSNLFWDPLHHDWIGIAMGAFAAPTNTKLRIHIYTAEKGDYYDITDEVPKHQGRPH